ncbi:MAG TPA: CBS domain-containing protein [Gaiellaceae bacterium]|nr:CBS domain-containing protein [Gaiellaceae bacterium]
MRTTAVPIVDVMSTRLVQADRDDSVRDASRRMVEAGVGSVAVCEGARLVGILTERDVLRLASEGVDLDGTGVRDAMTRDVVTISPDADILAAARLMGERQIRHLPVVEGENVLGIVGIRDVLAALAEALWRTHDEAVHETARSLLSHRP